ncbi:hypothetical protein E2562_026777 [Oryza meyeriana var. granulata]|uniref:Uncharacterized protein n=1 Tax=Oryza meyeriana var. granulata TaxID=110450 RepID=A0A6G1CA32_9ORYZ|nr:hypothetical protein E2562_026777 [Oryza meyeriana var. granulata]
MRFAGVPEHGSEHRRHQNDERDKANLPRGDMAEDYDGWLPAMRTKRRWPRVVGEGSVPEADGSKLLGATNTV